MRYITTSSSSFVDGAASNMMSRARVLVLLSYRRPN